MATSVKNQAPAGKGLKVTARPASFRRGGYTFTGEARTIALSELSKEQAEAITKDPNLVCQVVDIEPKAEEKPE